MPLPDDDPVRASAQQTGLEVTLTPAHAASPDLLVRSVGDRVFGGEKEIDFEDLRFRLGDRPYARNLRTWFESSGREVPPDLDVFLSHDIWVITHSVGIINSRAFRDVRSFGYRMEFAERPRVTVIDVLPQTQFIKNLGMDMRCEADLELTGQAAVPETPIPESSELLPWGGSVKIATSASLLGSISFGVHTPIVQAIGRGHRVSEWVFDRHKEPLAGDQIMIQTVLTPKRRKKLQFRAKVYATVTKFLIPVSLDGDWVDLECEVG